MGRSPTGTSPDPQYHSDSIRARQAWEARDGASTALLARRGGNHWARHGTEGTGRTLVPSAAIPNGIQQQEERPARRVRIPGGPSGLGVARQTAHDFLRPLLVEADAHELAGFVVDCPGAAVLSLLYSHGRQSGQSCGSYGTGVWVTVPTGGRGAPPYRGSW